MTLLSRSIMHYSFHSLDLLKIIAILVSDFNLSKPPPFATMLSFTLYAQRSFQHYLLCALNKQTSYKLAYFIGAVKRMIKEAIMTKDCKGCKGCKGCQDVLTTGSVRQKLVLLSEIIESQIYKYSAAIPIYTQF